jgi:hypothetical protein
MAVGVGRGLSRGNQGKDSHAKTRVGALGSAWPSAGQGHVISEGRGVRENEDGGKGMSMGMAVSVGEGEGVGISVSMRRMRVGLGVDKRGGMSVGEGVGVSRGVVVGERVWA